jgi:exonuclease III
MKEREIDIFAYCETKWITQRRKKLREEFEIIWSGEITEKRNGVAIIVSPTHVEMVTQTECISGRVMKIRILMKDKEINLLEIHAPQTECGNEEKKESKEILEDSLSREYICIMGDFNAQIGKDKNGYETIMGHHEEGNRNSEGELTGHL